MGVEVAVWGWRKGRCCVPRQRLGRGGHAPWRELQTSPGRASQQCLQGAQLRPAPHVIYVSGKRPMLSTLNEDMDSDRDNDMHSTEMLHCRAYPGQRA